ncbi:MAG: antirestriction protein [Methylococcaceae bacterium]
MITRNILSTQKRIKVTAELFGLNFPMKLEPLIFNLTDHIAENYSGGYWDFYKLSNGGFYMSPRNDEPFNVSCENGFEGRLSGDALGIVVCLYAYSHLSFNGQNGFDEVCAEHFHRLREFALDHDEAHLIMRAID